MDGWTNWLRWQGGSLTMPAVASSPQPVRSAWEPRSTVSKSPNRGISPWKPDPPWDLTMKNWGFNTNFLGDVSLRNGDLPMRNVEASNMWIEAANMRIRSWTLWSNTFAEENHHFFGHYQMIEWEGIKIVAIRRCDPQSWMNILDMLQFKDCVFLTMGNRAVHAYIYFFFQKSFLLGV